MARSEINVGVLLALSPDAAVESLRGFARRVVADVRAELEEGSGARWVFGEEEPVRLTSDDPRRPSDFLDEASLRMVEGPYDVVLVITNVALVSRRHEVLPGLPSPISNIAVLSTRKLLLTPRGAPARTLECDPVRWNAATLLLHLIGHLMGLEHSREGAMAPFAFLEERPGLTPLAPEDRRRLPIGARRLCEREHVGTGRLSSLWFHLTSAARHLDLVAWALLRNRAPLLPLALPGLVTAAVTPTFILVFTAEIWDAGLNMPERTIWLFAALSMLAATWYLTGVQNLFFPHKEKRVVTEHMAVVNVTILFTILFAVLGLFLMVALLMLFIETYIFPEGLISEWPTLQPGAGDPREDPRVGLSDKFLLAAFISTIGVLTGALAGGLESRAVIRHLALFRDEP